VAIKYTTSVVVLGVVALGLALFLMTHPSDEDSTQGSVVVDALPEPARHEGLAPGAAVADAGRHPEDGRSIDEEVERRRLEVLRSKIEDLRAYDASLASDARMQPGRDTIARHIAWIEAEIRASEQRLASEEAVGERPGEAR
jgi:hypothetical protein